MCTLTNVAMRTRTRTRTRTQQILKFPRFVLPQENDTLVSKTTPNTINMVVSTFPLFLTRVDNQYYRCGVLYLVLVALDEDEQSNKQEGRDSGDWNGCGSGAVGFAEKKLNRTNYVLKKYNF